MRKALKEKLNNIKWVSKTSWNGRMAKYAYLTDEWENRGIFLGKSNRGWYAFDNATGEDLDDVCAGSLEILNHRLNKLNKDNKFFDNIDRWRKREQS